MSELKLRLTKKGHPTGKSCSCSIDCEGMGVATIPPLRPGWQKQ